ncbi:MAG: hypothetical protein KGH59_04945, partial [Candidatus Micrarchaeota archaeon]|nr:hypothetical protein [Candidatus Micrarchaeota archaeon]
MAEKELILVDFDNTLFFTDKTAILASKELLGLKLTGTMVRMLPREIKSKVYELGYSKYRDHSVP